MADAKPHRTVSRVTDVLEMVAVSPEGLRLIDIADALNTPRSSMHGLLKGLEAEGYLSETRGRYSLGNAVGALLVPPRGDFNPALLAALESLRARFDETVMLGALVGSNLVYLAVRESRQAIRYSAPTRVRRPLYPTSAGRCFLAFAEDTDRERYLSAHVAADSVASVRAELREVRESGVAVNRGDTVADVYGVSSIVQDRAGVVQTLSVAGPQHRMADRLPEIVEAVCSAALNVQTAVSALR